MKLLKSNELESIAREATRKALIECGTMTPEIRASVVLGGRTTDDIGIFELYIPGETSDSAQVITRAIVDRVSGAVEVAVFI